MFKNFVRVALALTILASGLIVSTSPAFANEDNPTYSYKLTVVPNYVSLTQQLSIGTTITTVGIELSERTDISVEIPAGIDVPGVCTNETGCVYTTFQPAGNPPGSSTGYIHGYPTGPDGYYTFIAHFKTGNRPEVTIQQVVWLHRIGYPVITTFEPAHPRPGEFATIYGRDFLPLAWGENTSQLQICFFVQGWDGMICKSATESGVEWDQDSIQLHIPDLPSGKDIKVFVVRGQYSSMATPFSFKLNFGYFLPLAFK